MMVRGGFELSYAQVWSVATSPDGGLSASGGKDGAVVLEASKALAHTRFKSAFGSGTAPYLIQPRSRYARGVNLTHASMRYLIRCGQWPLHQTAPSRRRGARTTSVIFRVALDLMI